MGPGGQSFGFDRLERLSATVDAIRHELTRGPWVYRDPGAERAEGAFLAGTFWAVAALAKPGRTGEAGGTAIVPGTPDAASVCSVEMADAVTCVMIRCDPRRRTIRA